MYVFFLWLIGLEFAFSWKRLSLISFKQFNWPRTLATVVFLAFPTMYVLAFFYTGLHQLVLDLGRFLGVPFGGGYGSLILEQSWPLSFEHTLFAVCFSASIFLIYKNQGIRKLSIGLFFIWAVAVFYMLDAFFPFGKIWVLQSFVPFTANTSARILNWMGYNALTRDISDPLFGPGTILQVSQNELRFSVLVFWPSAGVHSMFIYALTILLFIKNISISLLRKAVIFVIGAVGTFMANILRIVTICIIGLRVGSDAAQHFHDYYGEFFFITWMVVYLGVIAFATGIFQARKGSPHDAFAE